MRFRETRLFGSEGELLGDGRRIRVFHFLRGESVWDLATELEASVRTGHAGGIWGLWRLLWRRWSGKTPPFWSPSPRRWRPIG